MNPAPATAPNERNLQKTAANRRYRQRMKEAGLCPLCPRNNPQPMAPDKTACQNCLRRESAKQRYRCNRKRQQGICRRCRTPAIPGSIWCAEHCQDRRDYYHRRRQAQRTARICDRCGNNPVTEPYARNCETCRAAARQRRRQKDNELNRQKVRQRASAGLCNRCGKTAPAPDRKRCRPCLDKAAAHQAAR